ncbi:MAG: hypothetical protein ACI85F_002126, partial [Bacteroidia bacterium]
TFRVMLNEVRISLDLLVSDVESVPQFVREEFLISKMGQLIPTVKTTTRSHLEMMVLGYEKALDR